MRAKDYLEQVRKMDKLIENKLVEKEQWFTIATSTTAASSDGDRVQTSSSQQKMADAVCRMIEIEKETNGYIDILINTKQEVIKTIEQLPAVQYDLLHKIYIQYKQLYEVAEMYGKSYTWARNKHSAALKNIQQILNGREETET